MSEDSQAYLNSHPPETNPALDGQGLPNLLFYGLQPLVLIAVMAFWLSDPTNAGAFVVAVIGVQLVLGVLEYWRPARSGWRQSAAEKGRVVAIFVTVFVATAWIGDWYASVLRQPLAALRETAGLTFWPHHWPLLAQALLVFLLSELIWYWFHRAEHRWAPVWRLSGHGAHHSFKHLNAINAGANHPLEYFLLLLPGALVELTFGVGAAVLGAVLLTVTQAAFAHANLRLNSAGIGWLLTTNLHHLRHHSIVVAESNTNYGCAAIVWDRVFGTFATTEVVEAGIGPSEPTTWEKFIMPVREPADSKVAPGAGA